MSRLCSREVWFSEQREGLVAPRAERQSERRPAKAAADRLKLYNIIFPLWLLIYFPPIWLITIPANALIDAAVVRLSLRFLKIGDAFTKLKKSLFRVVCFGFLADLIGAALMLAPMLAEPTAALGDRWEVRGPLVRRIADFQNGIALDPFSNVYALLWVLVCVGLSGALIYFFNRRYSFQKTDLAESDRHKLALALAVLTAPYIFLVPTALFLR